MNNKGPPPQTKWGGSIEETLKQNEGQTGSSLSSIPVSIGLYWFSIVFV